MLSVSTVLLKIRTLAQEMAMLFVLRNILQLHIKNISCKLNHYYFICDKPEVDNDSYPGSVF